MLRATGADEEDAKVVWPGGEGCEGSSWCSWSAARVLRLRETVVGVGNDVEADAVAVVVITLATLFDMRCPVSGVGA